MTDRKKLGNAGEEIAAKYLLQNGYKILARNMIISGREIDLIADRNGKTIFIEVKTRRGSEKNKTADWDVPLNETQAQRLKQAIAIYGADNHLSENQIRLDLIMIIMDNNQKSASLRHYADII